MKKPKLITAQDAQGMRMATLADLYDGYRDDFTYEDLDFIVKRAGPHTDFVAVKGLLPPHIVEAAIDAGHTLGAYRNVDPEKKNDYITVVSWPTTTPS